MTKKTVFLTVLVAFGLIDPANKTEAGDFSIHFGIHPWVEPLSRYRSYDDFRYGLGSYNYSSRTEVVVRNTSDQTITVSIVDQSGRKRKEKKLVPVAAHAAVRFVADSPNNSRVYRFIARSRDGKILAEKEVYLYGQQWNRDELYVK